MRLVDADEAYKVLTDYYHHRTEIQHKALKEAIGKVPNIDAVEVVAKNETTTEVVRCKDCKYYRNSNEKCGLIDTRLHFYETDKTWTEDCFCSWGERREDDNK